MINILINRKIEFISCFLILFFIPVTVYAYTNENSEIFEFEKEYRLGI